MTHARELGQRLGHPSQVVGRELRPLRPRLLRRLSRRHRWSRGRRLCCLPFGAAYPRIRFHDLRDTHATILLDWDVPLITVSQRLGHGYTLTTEKRYAHVTPRMKRRAAQVTAEVLDAFDP